MNLISTLTCRLATLSPTSINVFDDSDKHIGHAEAKNGAHLRVDIISKKFHGLSLLQRHRLVHESVGDFTILGIHALQISAQTPYETTAQTLHETKETTS